MFCIGRCWRIGNGFTRSNLTQRKEAADLSSVKHRWPHVLYGWLILLFWAFQSSCHAQVIDFVTEAQKLLDGSGEANDEFGWGVAASSGTVFISSLNGTGHSNSSGVIVEYRKQGNSWVENQRFFPPENPPSGGLGLPLAARGDFVFTAARFENVPVQGAGAVYAFKKLGGSWVYQQRLQPAGLIQNALFGADIQVASDHVLISSSGNGTAGNDYGRVYEYQEIAGTWQIVDVISAPPGYEDTNFFGTEIAVQGDRLMVGSLSDGLFEYRRIGGEWVFESNIRYATYVAELALTNNRVFIGNWSDNTVADYAGKVTTLVLADDEWQLEQELYSPDPEPGDAFGSFVLSANGNLYVGAHKTVFDFPFRSGEVFEFRRQNGSWRAFTRFIPSDPLNEERYEFGRRATHSSGTLFIAAPHDNDLGFRSGSVYRYDLETGTSGLRVISLGDSYSSGEGAGGYDPATNKFDSRLANYNRCHRSQWVWNGPEPGGSPDAYAFRDLQSAPISHSLVACSGAIADNIDAVRQVDSEGNTYAAPDNQPQLDRAELAGADAITLTIGGNDALFGDVISECFTFNCVGSDVLGQAAVNIDSLYARLIDAFNNVRDAAPGASVLVHGYPRLFSATYQPGLACRLIEDDFGVLRISSAEAQQLNALADKLNGVISCAAQSAGVHFVDTVPLEFEGHGVCAPGLDYINFPFTVAQLLIPWKRVELFHPNWLGQQAYARALHSWLAQNAVNGAIPPNPEPDNDLVFCDAVSSTLKGSSPSKSSSITFRDLGGEESLVYAHQSVVAGASAGFDPSAPVSVSVRRANGSNLDFGPLGSAQVDSSGVLRLSFQADSALGEGFIQIYAEQIQGDTNNVAFGSFLTGASGYLDSDGDGVPLGDDLCPAVPSAANVDEDGDLIGNACDICPADPMNDEDGDGICGGVDQCPLDPDDDVDNDGVCGNVDNCPLVSNFSQRDSDNDGAGDACDELSSGISGAWFDPAFDGEGWLVEVLDESTALVYWFTYPSAELPSAASQFWMVGVGSIVGNKIVLSDIRAPYGATFGNGFDPSDVTPAQWGSLVLEFESCNSGSAVYSGPNGYGSGGYSISRITSIDGLACDQSNSLKATSKSIDSLSPAYKLNLLQKGSTSSGFQVSGAWYDPDHDGEGWLLEYLGDGRVLIYWFTYDSDGDPMWMVGVGQFSSDTQVEVEFFRPLGTNFGDEFDSDQITVAPWGSGEFVFDSCGQGAMTYDGRQSGFGQGSFTVSRLTTVLGVPCEFPSDAGGGDGSDSGPLPIAIPNGAIRANDGNEFDAFGYSVAVDDLIAVVGARSADGGGAAYVFERVSNAQWSQRAKLTPPDASGSFGSSVAISDGRIVIGAPNAARAFLFEGSAANWNLVATLAGEAGSEHGFAVDISGDRAIVGAPLDGGSGAAFVYQRQGSAWHLDGEISGSLATASARFGSSVSISGNRALVGAPEDRAIDDDSGAAFVYRRTGGGLWVEDQRILPSDATSDMEFGYSVSLDDDRALVGAWRASPHGTESGAVYVFNGGSNNSWSQTDKLAPSDGAAGDWFGHSVSLHSTWALISAYGVDDVEQLAGGAYLYALRDGNWTQVEKLLPNGIQRSDTAGFSVSIGGSALVLGAWGDDGFGTTAGAAYVYSVVFGE